MNRRENCRFTNLKMIKTEEIIVADLLQITQRRRSDGRAQGSEGNARALQTNDEESEPKIG